MDTTLKTFIRENREQFDIYEPSDLWANISTQLAIKPAVAAKVSAGILKKGLLLSAAVITALSSYLYFNRQEKPVAASLQTELNTENEEQVIPVTDTVTEEKTDKKASVAADESKIIPVTPAVPATEKTAPSLPENEIQATPESPEIAESMPVQPVKTVDTVSDIKDSLFNGIKRIEIEGDLFNVYVKSHPGNSVLFHKESHISAHGLHSKINQYKIITEKKDSVLKISIDCDGKKGILIVGSIVVTASMDLTVPEGTDLFIHNMSGDIRLTGLKGKVDASSSSGNIRVEDINTDMKLHSSSGDISAKKCKGDHQIETSSGNQLIDDINGNLKIRSISGDCRLTTINGDLDMASSSGNQVLSGVTGTIHSASASGDIKASDCKGDLFMKTSSGNIFGKNNQLKSNAELESVSGDIIMDFTNDMKDLSFDLKTVVGDLSVYNGTETVRDEKRLSLNQGTIQVKGTTTSGNQVFK